MNYEQMAVLYRFLSCAVPGSIGVIGVWFLIAINRRPARRK